MGALDNLWLGGVNAVLAGDHNRALVAGNSKELLRQLPDACVDAVVTDPPYELGFMGKSWDKSGIANDPELWAEVLRVLKPGGHLLAFSGSRTYHRMTCAIEDAGFEVRDQIMWVYGSGMPKSHNGPWGGTALKPSHEPICVARKPLAGTVAANVQAHGTGALNIDGCRVPFAGAADEGESKGKNQHAQHGSGARQNNVLGDMAQAPRTNYDAPGRWPANLIHDGSPEVLALFPESSTTGARTAASKGAEVAGTAWLPNNHQSTEYTDSGSAARFFYCAKASRKDRNDGCAVQSDGTDKSSENNHPTVKPTELMRYLVRLVTPPGGVVLDPFMGSGSTGRGARLEGCRFIGFDLSPEYVAIAQRRIAAVEAIAPDSPAHSPSLPEKTPPAPASQADEASRQLSLLENP